MPWCDFRGMLTFFGRQVGTCQIWPSQHTGRLLNGNWASTGGKWKADDHPTPHALPQTISLLSKFSHYKYQQPPNCIRLEDSREGSCSEAVQTSSGSLGNVVHVEGTPGSKRTDFHSTTTHWSSKWAVDLGHGSRATYWAWIILNGSRYTSLSQDHSVHLGTCGFSWLPSVLEVLGGSQAAGSIVSNCSVCWFHALHS